MILIDQRTRPCLSFTKQFFAGLGSAVLNPKNALFYLTLMTVILGQGVTPYQQVFAGVWMTLVVLFWDTALAAAIGYSKMQGVLKDSIPLIEKTSGIALVLISVIFAIKLIYTAYA